MVEYRREVGVRETVCGAWWLEMCYTNVSREVRGTGDVAKRVKAWNRTCRRRRREKT